MPQDLFNDSPASDETTKNSPGPTLAERVRSLAFPGSDGASPGKRRSHNELKDDRESAYRTKYITELAGDRAVKERVNSLRAAAKEVHKHSSQSVVAILDAAHDFFEESAAVDARKTGFSFIIAALENLGLDNATRAQIFELIIKPADPSFFPDQITAIERLTIQGKKASLFHPRLIHFLTESLTELYTVADRSRAKKRSTSTRSNEEVVFATVLNMLQTLIAFDFENSIDEYLSGQLMIRLAAVCKQTTSGSDLKGAISIIQAITARTMVSDEALKPLIEVLCPVSYALDKIRHEAQLCLDRILAQSDQTRAMDVLLNTMTTAAKVSETSPSSIRCLRGTLLQLQHIYSKSGSTGIPLPSLAKLVRVLRQAMTVDHRDLIQNQTTMAFSLRAIASAVENEVMTEALTRDDWYCMEGLLEEMATTARLLKYNDTAHTETTVASPIYLFAHSPEFKPSAFTKEMAQALQDISQGLAKIYSHLPVTKQTLVINILLFFGSIVSPNVLTLTIDYMQDNRIVFPPDANWASHLQLLANRGFSDPAKDPIYKLRSLDLISQVYESIKGHPGDFAIFEEIFAALVMKATIISDPDVIERLADLASRFLVHTSSSNFEPVLVVLTDLAVKMVPGKVVLSTSDNIVDHVNRTSNHLVGLFIHCFSSRPEKAGNVFKRLISVASNIEAHTQARLDLIKLFVRLRCDSAGVSEIVGMPDTQGLAAILLRTEESATGRLGLLTQSRTTPSTEENPQSRSGRNSALGKAQRDHSRSRTRASIGDHKVETARPLWMYPHLEDFSQGILNRSDHLLKGQGVASSSGVSIDLNLWLNLILNILEDGADWEIYSYILVHLPSQLTNISLFSDNISEIERLHDLIVSQLQKGRFFEPPTNSGLKKGDVAVCLYHTLTVLVGYTTWFRPQKTTDMVNTFLLGISMWDRTAKSCIHGLALCCHELPKAIDRCLPMILGKMSQIIGQSHLAMDILEFLARLAKLPAAHQSITQEHLRTIFGICISHLHQSRDKRQATDDLVNHRSSNRLSNFPSEVASPSGDGTTTRKDLPEYVYALAYHVITNWFLATAIENRAEHVGWIAKNLAWKNNLGEEILEEQSQVTLDMMHRTAYLDLGETERPPVPPSSDPDANKRMWLIGMSIVTMETDAVNGVTLITKRQASGTTYATYQQHFAQLPSHHVEVRHRASTSNMRIPPFIYPHHVLLQLGSTISPTPIPTQPIVLPEDDQSRRALATFDKIDTVDGHKAGVIYIGPGQTKEKEILANVAGSEAFNAFLQALGTKVQLRGATFNTQGLDRNTDTDGMYTYAWRDRITEIVYHVPTMMPTDLEHDSHCANKKRHTGNDFVNIIFNESGKPFRFDTIKSAFNYVNIVIVPEQIRALQPAGLSANISRMDGCEAAYYFRVQLLCDPSLPDISSAATPKIVSALALPGYVRQLALSASVFCLVWSNRGGEHISNWRARLREIRRLRERYANTGNTANVGYPGMGTAADRGGAKSYVEGDDWKGKLAMGGLAEEGQFLMSLDFTRWT
ncbi:MAG: hypothetical protein Q9220_004945 [cf. Caloplaca sp. 1 TL-2023]